jgi:hypothetical protein
MSNNLDEIIREIQAYQVVVGAEAQTRHLLQKILHGAVELPPAVAGQPYPKPPPGCLNWFQLHPAEPAIGNAKPYFKYQNWTDGKKGRGGRWGQLGF